MKPINKKLLGPIVGTPPSLEWVPVERLSVDPAYQRTMDGSKSRKLVTGMVREWDWRQCQPLIVTRREDGRLLVLDGQHRLEGARQREDIPHLPCFVAASMGVEAEAMVFVKLNTQRQRLSQVEIFAGMVAAGDPIAIGVANLMEETGWRLARHTNTAFYEPGELGCAPMLAREAKRQGGAAVRNALTALREAFPDTPVRQGSSILRALIDLYATDKVTDPDAFIDALGAVDDPSDWMLEAQVVKQNNPALSRREALCNAFLTTAAAFSEQAEAA